MSGDESDHSPVRQQRPAKDYSEEAIMARLQAKYRTKRSARTRISKLGEMRKLHIRNLADEKRWLGKIAAETARLEKWANEAPP